MLKGKQLMWKIKNINNLALLSLEVWQAWGSVSNEEVLQCRHRALQAVTLSDKNPVYVTQWPMTVFGQPKYKCKLIAGAKVKGKLETNLYQIDDHKSKLWNWHRPYLRCPCHYKPACFGQLIWFDHTVWFILNHLEVFFTASSCQGRLVMLIKFLSGDARRLVLDHIAFLYIREFHIEGSQELCDHPDKRFFSQYDSTPGLRMVEALLKPGTFSANLESANKRRINLNTQPSAPNKWKGMYANPVASSGMGRGGSTNPSPTMLHGSRNIEGNARSRLGHGKALPGHISPLQRRNINF
ncbi:unnamed protein product [Calypogeia fissa]